MVKLIRKHDTWPRGEVEAPHLNLVNAFVVEEGNSVSGEEELALPAGLAIPAEKARANVHLQAAAHLKCQKNSYFFVRVGDILILTWIRNVSGSCFFVGHRVSCKKTERPMAVAFFLRYFYIEKNKKNYQNYICTVRS